jgi:hypothetical protein
MKDFVVRLLNERDGLYIKMTKLEHFLIESDKAESMDKIALGLLNTQLEAMKTYHRVLDERIALLLKERITLLLT